LATLPAELPVWGRVAAISGDGRRAIVAVGSLVRLYALDDSPRLLRVVDLSSRTFGPMAVLGLVLSRDGASFAASIVVPQNQPEAQSHRNPFETTIRTALLVFRGDSNAPVHERASSASVVPASGRLRPIERPVAISQDGRFLALDVTQLPSAGGGAPPAMSARASVLDLERNQVIVALPSRTLRPEPLGSWEVDGADDQTAAFDVSGTRVVFVRDAPDCQMVTEMTMSWLPIKVPGCTQHRISFSLWDLQTREQIAEMVLVKETGSRMSSPALSAMIGAIL